MNTKTLSWLVIPFMATVFSLGSLAMTSVLNVNNQTKNYDIFLLAEILDQQQTTSRLRISGPIKATVTSTAAPKHLGFAGTKLPAGGLGIKITGKTIAPNIAGDATLIGEYFILMPEAFSRLISEKGAGIITDNNAVRSWIDANRGLWKEVTKTGSINVSGSLGNIFHVSQSSFLSNITFQPVGPVLLF